MRQGLLLATFAIIPAGACRPAEPGAVPPATRADVATAMTDTAAGWFAYASDGTARSDTARRLAALALWDWEGGDRERGIRLLAAAQRLGVADSLFYLQGGLGARNLRQPKLAESLLTEAVRRWPRFQAAWRAYANLLEATGRSRDADSARARAAALEPDSSAGHR